MQTNQSQVKKNYAHGAAHHMAKLTSEQVAEMRLKRESGKSYGQLAIMFRCSMFTVRDIVTGRSRANG